MPLISSISGIRGTIGGLAGDNLNPEALIQYCGAYAALIREQAGRSRGTIILGRDARTSGEMLSRAVSSNLMAVGLDVMDIGLAPTPTVALATRHSDAIGGIVLTASHNPAEWNALKLLDAQGAFLSARDGEKLHQFLKHPVCYAPHSFLGSYSLDHTWIERHIALILKHPLVDVPAIRNAGFRLGADVVNSVGAIALPALFEALGVRDYHLINGTPDGHFAHNPEPLPAHLTELSEMCRRESRIGIAVDPDVDRLALVCEDGSFFGEEYTLVAAADYVLGRRGGDVVSNLSSTRALNDIAEKYGGKRYTSAVGEVNVVSEMQRVKAIIGGEGNGGVIFPEIHSGRDALSGIALILSSLAHKRQSLVQLRRSLPDYAIAKLKMELPSDISPSALLERFSGQLDADTLDRRDGLWIQLDAEWVHLRQSNTEPIIRIYAESHNQETALRLAEVFRERLKKCVDDAEVN
jgi:phosphomannomutase